MDRAKGPRGGEPALDVVRRAAGRAILVEPDGTVYAGRGYRLLRSRDDGARWEPIAELPRSGVRHLAEKVRLASRLLRHEIRGLVRLPGGALVVASREGVFAGREGETLAPARVEGGSYLPPMRISAGPDGTVVFGEYVGRRPTRPIRLFASRDGGRSFAVAHAFPMGSVFHVHNVLWDAGRQHYWVLAGDHGEEPGIARLSPDLTRLEWLVKGAQVYRAVAAFDLGDALVYGTDTELERNAVVRLDKSSGALERLQEVEGSCLYACRFGGLYALTTSVEPSAVNHSPFASLWLSHDGERWWEALRARKDRWSAKYFQFGSLVLPSGASDREVLCWSGQAVAGWDGIIGLAALRR